MALNIFDGVNIYGGWTKKGENIPLRDATSPAFYNSIDSMAEVTESDRGFGKSVCFFLHGGKNRTYKDLSNTSSLKVGDKINKEDLYVTVLSKVGEKDIYRITEEK